MPGMHEPITLPVTSAKFIHFDQLEAIPNYALRLNVNWDTTYGFTMRGAFVYISDAVNWVATPIALGTVVAVNGNTVTLARSAAVSTTKLNGKTLTKIEPDGSAITDLPATVQLVTGVGGKAFDPNHIETDVTFSGAHGLEVGDLLGSEGLTAAKVQASFDGLMYESKNTDLDGKPSDSAVRIAALTRLCTGAKAVAAIVPNRVRVRDDITFVHEI